jgi:predicted site-specific integrase-resolvase
MNANQAEGPSSDPDTYVSVDQACQRFGISRRSFYRWLALPETGLARVVVRVPPPAGRIRVPVRRFERWLHGGV